MVPDGHSAMNPSHSVRATDPLAIKTNRFRFLGKAGGKLKGDTHVRLVGENVSRVGLTLLKAIGGTATSWGMGESMATTAISELLA